MSNNKLKQRKRKAREMSAANDLEQRVMKAKFDEVMSKVDEAVCSCGCRVFLQGSTVKVASKERLALSGIPAQGDLVASVPVLYCAKCFTPFQPKPSTSLIQ